MVEIYIDDKLVKLEGVRDADATSAALSTRAHTLPELSIAENIFIGESQRTTVCKQKTLARPKILDNLNIEFDSLGWFHH